jgi:hypothetical protein
MGILAALVLAFGAYLMVMRWRKRDLPEETRELGARLGRSAHGALPLPGLTGQAPADFMPTGPIVDPVGTDEHHALVLDARGRPVVADPSPVSASEPEPSAAPVPARPRARRRRPR